ncbi:MAG: hypothetical protein EDX89_00340 [Acidobacteria bacterium]|nr:MAG: hypothetical protein EDX89_00340 [Acidobacteriota bacterium]
MTHEDPIPGSPAGPEEAEAARRLAEALEGGDPFAADAEALAAARLIASVAGDEVDDVAARRLRRALVAEASGRSRLLRRASGLAAAAAVAAGLLLPLLSRRPAPAGEALLDERERAARTAVGSLTAAAREADALRVATSTVASARSREIWSDLSDARLESLGRELATGSGSPSSHVPGPTPGGRS